MKIIELIGYEAYLKEELQLKLGTDGSYGIEQLLILPGEGWAGLVITATFHSPGGSAVQLLVSQDGVVDVPPEATDAAGRVARGSIVFAGTADGVQRISCDMPYWVAVHSGVEGSESQQPTPSFVQQALAEIRASCEAVDQAEKRIEQMEGSAPVRLGQLTNDCGFITAAVSDLEHYYKKSETYTQAEVNALLSRISHFEVAVVAALPATDISSTTVYLVPSGGNGTDLYTEYLYVSGKWETLGTQTLSLEDYATEAWVNDRLQSYPLRTEIPVQSVNGKTGQVTLSAADVGALGSGAQAADTAKLGGKAPAYYSNPFNLLDNSDFTNSVNQRGATGYVSAGYTIDRWDITANVESLTVGSSVTLASKSAVTGYMRQYLELNRVLGRTFTFAVCGMDGTVVCCTGTFPSEAPAAAVTIKGTAVGAMAIYLSCFTDKAAVQIGVTPGNTAALRWAALYEGSYTADTLPPYRPKGYCAELTECRRYFQRYAEVYSFVGSGFFVSSGSAAYLTISLQPMRANPTASGSAHIAVPSTITDTAPAVTAFAANGGKSGSLRLSATLSTAEAALGGQPCVLTIRSGDWLELSADL